MHERNIYKTPSNFAELAKKHKFLAPYLFLNPKGVPKIDFKDQAALRALTKALLLEDFQLHVEIPDDVLVPTVPLRLNYILWVEDLLAYNNGFGKQGSQICGIDVGTGATAVYALLGAKKNQWRMVGTEIEPASVMVARSNVKRNGLDQLVQIKPVKESVLKQVLAESRGEQYEFTMCNPPFFGNEDEADSLQKSRKEDRSEPSGAKTGTKGELIVSGGEFEFVSQMIADSKAHPHQVKIYTSMIGIKRHVKELISKLKSEGISNLTTTEFTQGKTMRWGLAWSFDLQVHLNQPAQVSHIFDKLPGCLNFENYIHAHLQTLNFKTLDWISSIGDDETSQTLRFVAVENTWTGQRKKRREMKRLEQDKKQVSNEEPPKKVLKLGNSADEVMECDSNAPSVPSTSAPPLPNILDGQIEIIREGPQATIAMRLLDGTLGKDGLNQIMTYLKNCYNRDSQNPGSELYQLLKCEKGE